MEDVQNNLKEKDALYTVSLSSIAGRNFVAGFMHALGGFAVTIISWLIIGWLFLQFVMPSLEGPLQQLENLNSVFGGTSTTQRELDGEEGTQAPSLPQLWMEFMKDAQQDPDLYKNNNF